MKRITLTFLGLILVMLGTAWRKSKSNNNNSVDRPTIDALDMLVLTTIDAWKTTTDSTYLTAVQTDGPLEN